MRIHAALDLSEWPIEGLIPDGIDVTYETRPYNRERLPIDAAGADGLVSLLTHRIDERFLSIAGTNLRVVANVAAGYDNFDLVALAERGVIACNTPGVLADATADLTMALILSTARRVVEADRRVRSGEAWVWDPASYLGLDLSAGSTLAIVGLGEIGMAVARRAKPFGMRLIATGGRTDSPEARELGVEAVDLETALVECDVLTLHCPLTPATRHLIGEAQFDRMRPSAHIVNTARGAIIDEAALARALLKRGIAGAGLDVYEFEPAITEQLLQLPNVIALPHIGSAGRATRERMVTLALRNAVSVLETGRALTPVQ